MPGGREAGDLDAPWGGAWEGSQLRLPLAAPPGALEMFLASADLYRSRACRCPAPAETVLEWPFQDSTPKELLLECPALESAIRKTQRDPGIASGEVGTLVLEAEAC